jgi:small-conductance mechanosensitive channel
MFDQLGSWLTASKWATYAIRIAGFYLVAYLIHRLAWRIAGPMVRLVRLTPSGQPRPERQATLHGLFASAISFASFAIATLLTIGQFVQADTLVWMVGLFSAAFGLGARPLISDVLTGIGFIFEDSFAVGEKVEILDVEGVIEAINLRTTWVRSPTGELYVLPNGEIRVVRNFSRGHFSTANVKLTIEAAHVSLAVALLEELGTEAMQLLPNLLEPWQVISESGEIGQQIELTLLAKARFGRAAVLRPRLLSLVQERLTQAGIALAA